MRRKKESNPHMSEEEKYFWALKRNTEGLIEKINSIQREGARSYLQEKSACVLSCFQEVVDGKADLNILSLLLLGNKVENLENDVNRFGRR